MKRLQKTITFLSLLSIPFLSHSQEWKSNSNIIYNNPITSNVGIGTITPNSKLEVSSANYINTRFKRANSSWGPGISLSTDYKPISNSSLGTILFQGEINSSYLNGAAIAAFAESTWAPYSNTRLEFYTSYNNNWSSRLTLKANGNLIVGNKDLKTPSGYKLFVEEGILTEKVKVAIKNTSDWSDFVFADNYNLKDLSEVETFINTNKHLPDVPSAESMVNSGLNVAEMDALLLQKIEELTLYIIELKKEVNILKAQE